jgi:hypothetical protein
MVELNRRRVIAGIGLAAGSAAVAPLLSAPAGAAAEGTDPDALFKAGRFDEAARGYEETCERIRTTRTRRGSADILRCCPTGSPTRRNI